MESSNRKNRLRPRHLNNSRITALCFLAGFSVMVAQSPAWGQSEPKEIWKVLDDQAAAWNRGDIDGYMKGYWNSDSTVFASGGNLTRGYHDVLARYKKSYGSREKMGSLAFRDLVVRQISPTAAVAMGIWELKRSADKPWGRFTLILEKKPEGWRITHDHTSSAEK
jgi:ketosteroid isomerase-like protein